MTDSELVRRILAFAAHIGHDAMDAARWRNWIDDAGRPTEEGASLVEALVAQRDTRTVFRGNF